MKKYYLEIVTPTKVFFKGDVEAVTFSTIDGLVTVLAEHQPTVFALQPGSLRIFDGQNWREAFMSSGFAQIKPKLSVILVQAAEWPEDIDEHLALEAKERAEELVRKKQSLMEYRMGKAALQRAIARLKVKNRKER